MSRTPPKADATVCHVERVEVCPACGNTRFHTWCRVGDRQFGGCDDAFEYSKCRACGLLFQSLRPPEDEIYKFYPADYAPYRPIITDEAGKPSRARGSRGLLRRVVSRAAREAESTLARLNARVAGARPDTFPAVLHEAYALPFEGARLLDFGCGSARFLNEARARGWQTLGVDFSSQALDSVRAAGHEALLMEPGSWEHIADASLDMVRLNHVLEHLYDPTGTMRALRSKMKPGAALHIAVPNPRGLSARVFRSCWHGLDAPRHICLFSPRDATFLLKSCGFGETRIVPQPLTRDFRRSAAYAAGALKLVGWERARQMAAGDFESPALYAAARLACAARLADRFHVFTRAM